MISPDTIQAIRDLPLDQAIGHYVPDLKQSGNKTTYKACSPFNAEKSASFYVLTAKGFWKDHSSGKGGRDVIGFLMQRDNLDYIDAIKLAAQDFNIELKYDTSAESQAWKEKLEKKKELQPVMDWAFSEFQKNEVPKAFLKRFPVEVCQQFAIGYCTGLIGEAVKAGYKASQLYECGLVNKNPEREEYFEKFADRVMFTVNDWRGHLIGFSGRVNGDAPKAIPKYLHSAFEKSKTLFAIDKAKKAMQENDSCYMVEGPTDTMRFHQMGISNATAMQGSDISEEQAKLIKRFCSTICFVPDNDADKTTNVGVQKLQGNAEVAIKAGLSVKVLMIKQKR